MTEMHPYLPSIEVKLTALGYTGKPSTFADPTSGQERHRVNGREIRRVQTPDANPSRVPEKIINISASFGIPDALRNNVKERIIGELGEVLQ